METTQMSTNWWMKNKIHYIYTYIYIYIHMYIIYIKRNHKKEQSTDVCYNVDEPQKDYAT